MVIAVVALTFASCGNQNKNGAPVEDTTAIDTVAVLMDEANQEADAMISGLAENLEAKDASAFQTALEAVKAKIAEYVAKNPEVAKAYMTKVQNFLKENADKVKAVVGNNAAVTAAVAALTESPVDNFISNLTEGASDAANAAKDAVEGAADNVKDAANNAVEGAKDAVNNAKDAASNAVNNAKENAKDAAGKAVDNAAAGVKKGLGL